MGVCGERVAWVDDADLLVGHAAAPGDESRVVMQAVPTPGKFLRDTADRKEQNSPSAQCCDHAAGSASHVLSEAKPPQHTIDALHALRKKADDHLSIWLRGSRGCMGTGLPHAYPAAVTPRRGYLHRAGSADAAACGNHAAPNQIGQHPLRGR